MTASLRQVCNKEEVVMKKRSLSLFLAMVTVFSLLLTSSTTVFADTADGGDKRSYGRFRPVAGNEADE